MASGNTSACPTSAMHRNRLWNFPFSNLTPPYIRIYFRLRVALTQHFFWFSQRTQPNTNDSRSIFLVTSKEYKKVNEVGYERAAACTELKFAKLSHPPHSLNGLLRWDYSVFRKIPPPHTHSVDGQQRTRNTWEDKVYSNLLHFFLFYFVVIASFSVRICTCASGQHVPITTQARWRRNGLQKTDH